VVYFAADFKALIQLPLFLLEQYFHIIKGALCSAQL